MDYFELNEYFIKKKSRCKHKNILYIENFKSRFERFLEIVSSGYCKQKYTT